jgi:F-box-like
MLNPVAFGPQFLKENEEETRISISFRISVFVLGVIALIIGSFVLTDTFGLDRFGPACGWSLVALGTALDLASLLIKCVKKRDVQEGIFKAFDSPLNQNLSQQVAANPTFQNENDQINDFLPKEIMELIFEKLTTKSLNKASLVSRNWHQIADQSVFWANKLYRDYDFYNQFFNRTEFIAEWKKKGSLAKHTYLSMSTKRFSSPIRTVKFSHDKNIFKNGPEITALRLFKDVQGVIYLLSHGVNNTLKFWNIEKERLEWELDYSQYITKKDEFYFYELKEANDICLFIEHKYNKDDRIFIIWNQKGMHLTPKITSHSPPKLGNPFSQPVNFLQHFETKFDNWSFNLCNTERQITKAFHALGGRAGAFMIGNTLMIGTYEGSVQFFDYRTTTLFYSFKTNSFLMSRFEAVRQLTYDFGVLACGGTGTITILVFDSIL